MTMKHFTMNALVITCLCLFTFDIAMANAIVREQVIKRNAEPLRERKLAKVHVFAKKDVEMQNTNTNYLKEIAKIHLLAKGTVEPKHVNPLQERPLAKKHLLPEGTENGGNELVSDSQSKTKVVPNEKSDFRPLPFPVDFQFYDVDQNGEITLHELIETTGTAENVRKAFAASDADGDGMVTLQEYTILPWGYNQGDVVLQD